MNHGTQWEGHWRSCWRGAQAQQRCRIETQKRKCSNCNKRHLWSFCFILYNIFYELSKLWKGIPIREIFTFYFRKTILWSFMHWIKKKLTNIPGNTALMGFPLPSLSFLNCPVLPLIPLEASQKQKNNNLSLNMSKNGEKGGAKVLLRRSMHGSEA